MCSGDSVFLEALTEGEFLLESSRWAMWYMANILLGIRIQAAAFMDLGEN